MLSPLINAILLFPGTRLRQNRINIALAVILGLILLRLLLFIPNILFRHPGHWGDMADKRLDQVTGIPDRLSSVDATQIWKTPFDTSAYVMGDDMGAIFLLIAVIALPLALYCVGRDLIVSRRHELTVDC